MEEAAQRLYEQWQAQPALLNDLRAARVTEDSTGVALALKSGGIAPSDLILAPALLLVTTLLTESALGKCLDTIMAKLKERQRQPVNDDWQGSQTKELRQLSSTLPEEDLFAQLLEPELQRVMLEQVTANGKNT